MYHCLLCWTVSEKKKKKKKTINGHYSRKLKTIFKKKVLEVGFEPTTVALLTGGKFNPLEYRNFAFLRNHYKHEALTTELHEHFQLSPFNSLSKSEKLLKKTYSHKILMKGQRILIQHNAEKDNSYNILIWIMLTINTLT